MANEEIFEKDKKDIILRLRLNPRTIERGIFIIIILVLAYFAFWGKMGSDAGGDITAASTVDTEAETAAEEEEVVAEAEEELIVIVPETVEPEPTNQAPEADFTFTPATPEVDERVSFTDASSDADEDELTYIWKFGDGKTSAVKNPTHTYDDDGEYDVTLTVSDGELDDVKVKQIPVNEVSYDGKVHLTLDDVKEEKGTYESTEMDWGKVTEITFTIDNQKKDFMPEIEVYTYNSDSSTLMKSIIRGEIIYSTQKLGEKKQHSLEIASQPFTDLDKTVFIKIVLKDNDSDDEVETLTGEHEFS